MFSWFSNIVDNVRDSITDVVNDQLGNNDSSSSGNSNPTTSKTKFLASFYGLGGAGGFHEDWLEKIADKAGSKSKSTVHKYDFDQGQQALTDLFSAIDINLDHVISAAELKKTEVRVVGYSLGGVGAANFTRELNRAGEDVAGYHLDTAISVKSLVTIDPVNNPPPQEHTDGPLGNVKKFTNYYQQRGGSTSIDVLEKNTKIKLTTLTFDVGSGFVGGPLDSAAQKTKQTRIDTGSAGKKKITQDIQDGALGRMRGRDVNHGTITWYVYADAVDKLK